MSDNSAHCRRLPRRLATVATHCTILSLLTVHSCSGFIVYPKLLEGRVEGGPLTLHVHPSLILTLEKSSILANNLHFVSSSLEGSRAIVLNGRDLERNLYHDVTHKSSLIVEEVPGGVEVRGVLTYRHRISPFLASRSRDGDSAHLIEEIEESLEESPEEIDEIPGSDSYEGGHDSAGDSQDLHCASFIMEHPKVEPQLHDEFIVEVCVVVSKNYSAAFKSDKDLVEYIGALFNWAAIPYFDMECPRIRFQINAILTVEDDFLFRNETCGISTDTLKFGANASVCGYNAEETMNNTVDYINACFHGNCDIVFHLTSQEIFLIRNGTFRTEVAGLTTAAGVCSVEKFAVGEDLPPTYNGRVTVAHEIGHLLGCVHDGCPKAANCSHKYGNLMSSFYTDIQNKSKLSECCKSSIQDLVSELPHSCINVSTSANYTNDFLPGENITEEQFCNLTHPGVQVAPRHETDSDECYINCCWNGTDEDYEYSEEEYSDTTEESTTVYNKRVYEDYCRPDVMLDGMTCGENKTCYRSNCSHHNWTEIRLKYHTIRTFP